MKDKNENPDSSDITESGEEELAILIKEAGKTDRARKKKPWMNIFKNFIWQLSALCLLSNQLNQYEAESYCCCRP